MANQAPGRYSIKAAANKKAEIWIYEEIGDSWYGGISADRFRKDLQALGDIDEITLHINSPGGNVFDANAICNILRQHKAHVDVYIEGLAASSASVIAMAGNRIYIAGNAMVMIHNAWTYAAGYASELRETADLLDKVTGTIRTTYMARTRLDEKTITGLMDAETWMNAEEALSYGFADEITEEMEVAAHFDLSKFKYRNAPKPPQGEYRSKLARMSLVSQKIRSASTPKR